MGLDSVMVAAEGCEVTGTGLVGWAAVVDRNVRVDVVEVAGARGAMTTREDAEGIAEPDQVGHPCRRIVPVDGVDPGQVEHGLDLEGGVGQPGAQDVDQHRAG